MGRTTLQSKYQQVVIFIGLFITSVFKVSVINVIFGIFEPFLIDYFGCHIVTMVGTFTIAGSYLSEILCGVTVDKIGKSKAMFIGGILCFLGLFISALSTNIYQLAFGHGLILPIGTTLTFNARVTSLNEYFQNRYVLISNLVSLGSPLGMMIAPVFTENLILTYGFRGAYLILSGIMLNICVSATLCRTKRADVGIPAFKHFSNSTAEPDTGCSSSWLFTVLDSTKFYELKETGGYFTFIFASALAVVGYSTSILHLSLFAIVSVKVTPMVAATFVSTVGLSGLVTRLLIVLCDMYYTVEGAMISIVTYSIGICSILNTFIFLSPTQTLFIIYAVGTGFGGTLLLFGYPVIIRRLCKHLDSMSIAVAWAMTIFGSCSLTIGIIYSFLHHFFRSCRVVYLGSAILEALSLLIIFSSSSLRRNIYPFCFTCKNKSTESNSDS